MVVYSPPLITRSLIDPLTQPRLHQGPPERQADRQTHEPDALQTHLISAKAGKGENSVTLPSSARHRAQPAVAVPACCGCPLSAGLYPAGVCCGPDGQWKTCFSPLRDSTQLSIKDFATSNSQGASDSGPGAGGSKQ